VADNRPEPNETPESGQILSFQLRRRAGPRPVRDSAARPDGRETEPIDELAAFEAEDRHIDYRHRMMMNVIAVAIVALLVGAGVWIADTIATMQQTQDCVLQGRQNCAPIEVPAAKP
jgi:hypothetical protein